MLTRRSAVKAIAASGLALLATQPAFSLAKSFAAAPLPLSETVKIAMSIAKVAKTASEAALNFTKVWDFIFGSDDADFGDIIKKLGIIEHDIKVLQIKVDELRKLVEKVPDTTVKLLNEQKLIVLINNVEGKRSALKSVYKGNQKNFRRDHKEDLDVSIRQANELKNAYLNPKDDSSYAILLPFMATLLTTQIAFYRLAGTEREIVASDLRPFKDYFESGISATTRLLASVRDERLTLSNEANKTFTFLRPGNKLIECDFSVGVRGESVETAFAEYVLINEIKKELETTERYLNCLTWEKKPKRLHLSNSEKRDVERHERKYQKALNINLTKILTHLQGLHTANASLRILNEIVA
jgi:hypothetical protein